MVVNSEMKVVGMTTQQIIHVASQKRKFRINEILIIEDDDFGLVKGEVIETSSFNQFIPMTTERNKMIDSSVLESLRQVGYTIDDAEISIAKVRMLTELMYPIKTGSLVRIPRFQEIENMLIQDRDGWNVGVLRGTDEVAPQMPEDLQNRGALYYPEKGIIPYNSVPFLFNYRSMYEYPHIGIFGGSGSGKSYGSRVLEEEIMKGRIPALVGDPHYEKEFKDYFPNLPEEYRMKFSNRYEVFTIGKDVGIPFETLTATDLVKLLSAASDLSENMDSAVRQLINRPGTSLEAFKYTIDTLCYAHENSRKLEKDYDAREELDHEEKVKIEEMMRVYKQYGDKCNHAAAKGIQWRLNRLIGFRLFQRDSNAIFESLKARKLVVIRGSIEHLKLFFSYVLNKVYNIRREYRDAQSQNIGGKEFFPPFITVLDEAHNFAPKAIDSPTKGVLKEIAQEGRKYGVFLIFATQRPALLDDTIMAQLSTKFLFRTVRGQDIKSLAEETDLTSEDANRLPYLPSGECFVSSAVIGRTIAVRVRCSITKSPNSVNPFDELDSMSVGESNPLTVGILAQLPFQTAQLHKVLQDIEKQTNVRSSMNELKSHLEELVDQGRVIANKTPFGDKYEAGE